MAARVCVQKSFLENSTFNQWLDGDSHTYVGEGLAKYSGGKYADSIWAPSTIFKQYSELSIETKLFHYEQWVRTEMFSELHLLYGEFLGCFCHPLQKCHADILVRVVQETFSQAPDEVSSVTKSLPNSPIENPFRHHSQKLIEDKTKLGIDEQK